MLRSGLKWRKYPELKILLEPFKWRNGQEAEDEEGQEGSKVMRECKC